MFYLIKVQPTFRDQAVDPFKELIAINRTTFFNEFNLSVSST